MSGAVSFNDRFEIIEAVNGVAMFADERNWAALRQVFDDVVVVDYTSIAGGTVQTMPADDLVASWKGVLGGFDATRHLVGTHLVTLDGDQAECRAAVLAVHSMPSHTGESLWMVGGQYVYKLRRRADGWKITHTTFKCQWGSGNQALAAAAAQRGGAQA